MKHLSSRGRSLLYFQAVPCGPRHSDGFTTHVGATLSPNNNVIQIRNEKVVCGSSTARLFYVFIFTMVRHHNGQCRFQQALNKSQAELYMVKH